MIATATLPIKINQKRSDMIICDKTHKLFPQILYGYTASIEPLTKTHKIQLYKINLFVWRQRGKRLEVNIKAVYLCFAEGEQ